MRAQSISIYLQATNGVASPKIWGMKIFDFKRKTLFCLEKTLLKAQNDYMF